MPLRLSIERLCQLVAVSRRSFYLRDKFYRLKARRG